MYTINAESNIMFFDIKEKTKKTCYIIPNKVLRVER